jgi:hypothetical protein
MIEASGDGWVELQPDGSFEGQSASMGGMKPTSPRAHWKTSSTAC